MSSARDHSSSLSTPAGQSAAQSAAPDMAELLASAPGVTPVDDAAFAAAYEATGDVGRARLKTCIARLHVLYGAAGGAGGGDVREGSTAIRWRQGFASLEQVAPCAWTLVCVDAAWTSAPRLLAALLPALFAGVGSVAVVRVNGDGPWPAPVLAALELAGQEVVADAAPAVMPALLRSFAHGGASQGMGRLLLLGEHPDAASDQARALGVPVWRDDPAPIIGIADGTPEIASFDWLDAAAALRAAHPDAAFVEVPATPSALVSQTPLAAVACGPDHASAWLGHAGLVLGPGHEWCWMHPGLSPAWFTRRAVALLPVPPSRAVADLP